MIRFALAIAAALTVTPSLADCTPPKIIGLDYHTARAMLIKAGCRPVAYNPNTHDHGGRPAPSDAVALGYIEADHASNGSAGREMQWSGFTVYARSCEDFTVPALDRHCRVRSVIAR